MLNECPDSPNCVNTHAPETDEKHFMPAISFDTGPEDAMQAITEAVTDYPRTTIIESDNKYQHAEFKIFLFGWIDDVEFFLDTEKKLIHFRSASRVGYSDLGVNRRRMKRLTKAIREKLAS